mgnify:CR=1 FL=1
MIAPNNSVLPGVAGSQLVGDLQRRVLLADPGDRGAQHARGVLPDGVGQLPDRPRGVYNFLQGRIRNRNEVRALGV